MENNAKKSRRMTTRVGAVIVLGIFIMSVASCELVKKIVPPGQAKKITGQKSASGLVPGK